MSDPFRYSDAPYVLGALDADEAAAYEAHVEVCPDCARRLAEVAPVVHQLAGSDLVDDEPPPTVLPGLVRAVRAERRRRRVYTALAAAAAAACIAIMAGVLTRPAGSGDPVQRQAMAPIGSASALSATAEVRDVAWGTRIDLVCKYKAQQGGYGHHTYALEVVDRSGSRHRLGDWEVYADQEIRFTSGTSLRRADIRQIDVVTTAGVTMLQLPLR